MAHFLFPGGWQNYTKEGKKLCKLSRPERPRCDNNCLEFLPWAVWNIFISSFKHYVSDRMILWVRCLEHSWSDKWNMNKVCLPIVEFQINILVSVSKIQVHTIMWYTRSLVAHSKFQKGNHAAVIMFCFIYVGVICAPSAKAWNVAASQVNFLYNHPCELCV